MDNFILLLIEPLKNLYAQFSALLPNVLAMMIILLGGIAAARIFRAILLKLLQAFRFDAWSDRMGFTTMLRRGDVWTGPSAVVGSFLFWFLVLVSLLTGFSALHIRVVDAVIREVMSYLPRVISAVLIMVFGYIASGVVVRGLLISLVNSGFHFSKELTRAVRLLLIVLIIAMALEQLRVAPGVVVAAFSIAFGGIVLALAISFGIAGVDLAKRIMGQESDKKDSAPDDLHRVGDPPRDVQHV